MWNLNGTPDPETGHVVGTALRSAIEPTLLDPSDTRSMPQRRNDALGEIRHFYLDHDDSISSSGGERPRITVTIPYDTLVNGAGFLPEIDGTPVDPETIRRIACDAGIVRIITDVESQPLDVSRRIRTAPPAIRRALVSTATVAAPGRDAEHRPRAPRAPERHPCGGRVEIAC